MKKLYLDDERTHPEGWIRAHNAKEAKEILLSGEVTFASLDHDLFMDRYWSRDWNSVTAYELESGLDVVEWMVENNIWPEEGLRIHTDYTTGRLEMMKLVEEYGPYGEATLDDNVYYPTEGPGILYKP